MGSFSSRFFRWTPRQLTRGAVIAALYTALSLLLAPISMGKTGIDFRIAESFTLLPVLLPESIPALFIGCLLTNLLAGGALPDILFGSIATLLAAFCTYRLRNRPITIAALPPVLLNLLIVGPIVHYLYMPSIPLLLCMLSVGAGQAVACYALGIPLLFAIRRIPERVLRD